MSRTISTAGINLIKSFEGFCGTAYRVPVGYNSDGTVKYDSQYYTIGYGHCGADVKAGQTITESEAVTLLQKDLKYYVSCVNNKAYCPVTEQLNQNQFDALVSICYNCGAGGLQDLCAGRTIAQIGNAIPTHYCYSNGEYLQGLANRRKKEQALFNTHEITKVTLKSAAGGYKSNEADPLGGSAQKIITIPKGATVTWVCDDGYGWSKVTYKGKTYWIVNSKIKGYKKLGLSTYPVVTAKKGKMVCRLNSKKTAFAAKTVLKKNRKFTIICTITSGKHKGYYYCKRNGKYYYIKS